MTAPEWKYSRNQRRHWVDTDQEYDLFEIKDCAPFGYRHRSDDGYELYYRGILVTHARTVKQLKDIAVNTKEFQHHELT